MRLFLIENSVSEEFSMYDPDDRKSLESQMSTGNTRIR